MLDFYRYILLSRFWCFYENFNFEKCRNDSAYCLKEFSEPLSVSHSFVTTKSNVASGKLYEVIGLKKSGYHYTFVIHKVDVKLRMDEEMNSRDKAFLERDYKIDYLKLERSEGNIATLALLKPIEGPREFNVQIDVVSRDQPHLNVLHRSVVHVYVSEFDGQKFS